MRCDAKEYSEKVSAYLSSVYRENASVFGRMSHTDVHTMAQSLGWVYHQAHWTMGNALNANVSNVWWPYECPWMSIKCLSLYTGYKANQTRRTETLASKPPHLLVEYNKYGLMRGAGQQTCHALLDPLTSNRGRVEVLRIAGGIDKYEYGDSGCWYYAMPGSGIFLDLGQTVRARNRAHLGQLLGLDKYNASELSVITRLHHHWTWTDVQAEMERSTAWIFERRIRICKFAARLGYDTVQIVDELCTDSRYTRSAKGGNELGCLEIVSCSAGCTTLPFHRARSSPCIPGEALYTGLHATRPCTCNATYPLLNCHLNAPRVSALAHRRAQGGYIMHQLRSDHSKPCPL